MEFIYRSRGSRKLLFEGFVHVLDKKKVRRPTGLLAKCPFGKMSFGKMSFGKMSFDKESFGKMSFGKMSFGKMSFGKESFGKMSGHRYGEPGLNEEHAVKLNLLCCSTDCLFDFTLVVSSSISYIWIIACVRLFQGVTGLCKALSNNTHAEWWNGV